MEKFKKELALFCFNNGVTLKSLKEYVNNWGNEGKAINTPVINLGEMVEGFKHICTLDGKDYYLSGDTYLNDVDWHTAKGFAEGRGDGWELPSRKVLDQMFFKRKCLGIGENEWLWSGDEETFNLAWNQYFDNGRQYSNTKTHITGCSVRPVYVTDSFEW